MRQHSADCPCPHLDSTEDQKSEAIYSASMFNDRTKTQIVGYSDDAVAFGLPRRGFESFCEQLLSEGYYEAFWHHVGSESRLPKSSVTGIEDFFRAVRSKLSEPVFSFALRFADVVARAGRESAVFLLDAPLHELLPRLGVKGSLAIRPNSRWQIATSSRASCVDWRLSEGILRTANGRARHENGLRKPPYFAVLVGSRNGERIECEHCYLHPVELGTSLFAAVASNLERPWLQGLRRTARGVLYKPVSRPDFNNTMARVLACFNYGWNPQNLVPDALEISERGILVRECRGRDDASYLLDFEEKKKAWNALKLAIPVLSFDWDEIPSSVRANDADFPNKTRNLENLSASRKDSLL